MRYRQRVNFTFQRRFRTVKHQRKHCANHPCMGKDSDLLYIHILQQGVKRWLYAGT